MLPPDKVILHHPRLSLPLVLLNHGTEHGPQLGVGRLPRVETAQLWEMLQQREELLEEAASAEETPKDGHELKDGGIVVVVSGMF